MRPVHSRIFFIIIAVIVGFVGLATTLLTYVQALRNIQDVQGTHLNLMLGINALRVAHLENQVRLLVADNQNVRTKLADETAKRLEAEEQQTVAQTKAQQQISQLTKDLMRPNHRISPSWCKIGARALRSLAAASICQTAQRPRVRDRAFYSRLRRHIR